MKRTYELTIERTIVDTYVVEAVSRTDASMQVSALMLNGTPPTATGEIKRKVSAPIVVEMPLPVDATE